MINSGTKIPQLISCTLIENKDDSRQGILETLTDVSNYSSNAAGIGLCLSNVRSAKSKINTSGGNAGGLLKYIKMVNENLRFFNQQGRRPGAAAIYIEPWHKDIYDVIHIKNPNGKDELRARDTFLALWCPDLFFRTVEKGLNGEDDTWYLFCPNDVKKAGLKPFHKIYGDEFDIEYQKAIDLGIGEKVSALDIWKNIYTAHMETGIPYILAKDNANKKSNHKNIGPLIMSNLCAEIFEVATPDETAQCTLGSMVLKNFINSKTSAFDYKLLVESVGIMVRMLNKAIDINEYSTTKGELCGKKQRALAIGVQGLADVFFIKDVVYDSDE
jgi:ribonucleotide reductase alpha subunit